MSSGRHARVYRPPSVFLLRASTRAASEPLLGTGWHTAADDDFPMTPFQRSRPMHKTVWLSALLGIGLAAGPVLALSLIHI